MKKVVIAIDSYKGSLTARQACAAVAEPIRERYPECEVIEMPVSDGGEGLTDVLVGQLSGHKHKIMVVDPLMRELEVELGSVEGCAIVEMAAAAGLTLLKKREQNPMKTTTYGVGLMIRAAIDLGYKKILLGLGGSATTDAGFGALQALGLRCFNSQGRLIKEPITGAMLADIVHIDSSALRRTLADIDIRMVCDVENPFCGPNGAAMVFSKQKGASYDDLVALDAGLRNVAHVIKRSTSISIDTIRGAGAAGGFAGSLASLANARIVKGIDQVLSMLHFDEKVEGADLIVTGEGRIDSQSFMGKVVGEIVGRMANRDVAVLAVTGQLANRQIVMNRGLMDVVVVTPENADFVSQMVPDVARVNIINSMREWLKEDHLGLEIDKEQ